MRELQKSPGVRYMGTFHVIALEDWMQFIVDHNLFHILCGLNQPDHKRERAILREFWKLYRAANPNHQMWDMIDRHNIQLSRLAPMLLHGDEGRGRKKMPFLITSYHSMIGFGTTLANEQRKQRLYLQLRLNYSGSSHTTRMISGCLPKMTKDEVALKDLLSFTAGDCMRTFQTGVANQEGERYHAICLNAVGDWMWLAKAANLQRSFANVPKQALVPTSVPKGICHYCHAGQTNYDFEDLGFNPAWKRTIFLPGDQPWKSRPALLDLPHDPSKPAAFFSFDIWHAFHLGLGKVFVASALACISDLFRGTNIDARFLELTDLYLQWCDENRTPAYIIGITKETCGWFDRKTYPNGQWHKGHITTTLLRFLESWFSKKRCFTGCNLVMLQRRNTLCQSLLPPNVCQWPVAWTRFGPKHWRWWHGISMSVSKAGARIIQSGESSLPVPPQDAHRSPHDAGVLWHCLHNIVSFGIWRPGRRGFHRKEEPLGAARGTNTGDLARAATVTAGCICLLAWSWLHQGLKKVGDFGGHSCGMMGCFIKDHNIIILFNFVKSMKLMDFWKPRFSTETSAFQSWPVFLWVSEAPGIMKEIMNDVFPK